MKKSPKRPIRKGTVDQLDIADAYLDHSMALARGIEGLRVVVDCSNGSAGAFLPKLLDRIKGTFIPIYESPDGRLPHHGPDPLSAESQDFLRRTAVGLSRLVVHCPGIK